LSPAAKAVLSWGFLGASAIAVLVAAFVLPEGFLRQTEGPTASPAAAAARPADGSTPDVEEDESPADVPGAGAVEITDDGETDGLDALAVDEGTEAPEAVPVELPSGRILVVPPGQRRVIQHVVVPIESLDQIAHRYGVRPDSLRIQNGLKPETQSVKNGSTLRVKAKKVPPTRVLYRYVVQPGDSWWKIGTRFGVDSVELRAANGDPTDRYRLRVGQTLEMWLDPVLFEWIAVEERPDDPTAIRPGAASVGTPQNGRLINGVEIPDAPHIHKKYPSSSFGTTHAVTVLMEGLARFHARYRTARPLSLGQMSRRHGGPLQGHLSHQSGRDIDIRLPLRADFPDDFGVRPERVDWTAVWHLVSAFIDTGEILVIFLDYDMQQFVYEAAKSLGSTPEELRTHLQVPGGRMAPGLVRHSPGHEAHIHVRFKCGPHEPECVQSVEGEEVGD
jgi:LysM repeat protein